MSTHNLVGLSRSLRRTQTSAEKLLWSHLRNHQLAGFKFRRQYPVAPYILDFYCSEAHLGIELDGGQHNENKTISYDQERLAFFRTRGISVIRFWNHEVINEIDAVLEKIVTFLTPALSH